MRTQCKLCVVLMMLGLVLSTVSASPQSVQVIKGSDTPDLIPNYYAWETFFRIADTAYRMGIGYYRHFVLSQLGLGKLLPAESQLRKQFLDLLIEEASIAAREEQRLTAQSAMESELLKEGIIQESVSIENKTRYLKEQVSSMRSRKVSFRTRVRRLDPVLG